MTPTQDALSQALFSVHEAAMDAANDPNSDTLRAYRKATQKVDKLVGRFQFERTQALVERTRR